MYQAWVITMPVKSIFDWFKNILTYELENYENDFQLYKDIVEISNFAIDLIEFPIPRDLELLDVEFEERSFFDLFEDGLKKSKKIAIFWDNRYYSHENLFERYFTLYDNQLLIEIYNNFCDKLGYYGFDNLEHFLYISNNKNTPLLEGQNKFILPT